MNKNELSYKIYGAAVEMHRSLGPELLESVYEAAFAHVIQQMGLDVKTQVPMSLVNKEVMQDVCFRIDLIVENMVIDDIKSVENLASVHFA